MSLTELFPDVKLLPRADKLRLMQFLAVELAQEEGAPLSSAAAEYPIWTPLNAFDAAETLAGVLKNRKTCVRIEAPAQDAASLAEANQLAELVRTELVQWESETSFDELMQMRRGRQWLL